VFFDEFGFSLREAPAPTWAPKGQRPILRRVTNTRPALAMGVGLTLSGDIYTRQFPKVMRSTQVIAALRHVLRYLPTGFILVWDPAPIHRSKVATAFLAAHPKMRVEWLPAHAPELNPEEYCHGHVKQRLRNAAPTTVPQMRTLLHRGFARLRHRPDLLLGFVHAAGLPVKRLW
jgi:transposase